MASQRLYESLYELLQFLVRNNMSMGIGVDMVFGDCV
jgi:hypothetical protein